MTWRLGDRQVRRILVTRLRYLGDIVMTTVVLDALKEGAPDLELGYLCEAAHAPVLTGQPALTRIHALKTRRRGADAQARARAAAGEHADGAAGAFNTWRDLRAARYDLAVDLFFNPRSAWQLRLSGIDLRLAGPAGSRSRLYTHRTGAAAAAHLDGWAALAPGGLGDHLVRLAPLTHVESGLDFLSWFAARGIRARPRLGARAGAGGRAAALLRAAGLTTAKPFLVLAPGATWATKRWPPGHWRTLVAGLETFWPGDLVVLTPPGDAGTARGLVGAPAAGRGIVLPALPLSDALDVLAASAGIVTVDGGLMHAAVGLGVRTLALFGPTDPVQWFPYEGAGPFRVLATRPACHPCHLHECAAFICLPGLSPEAVLAAAQGLFTPAGHSGEGTYGNEVQA